MGTCNRITPVVLLTALLLGLPVSLSRTLPVLVSISVTQIVLPGDPLQLAVGATRQFIANGTYSDGSTKYLTQAVTWSSSNNAVASVEPTMGLVTALGPGSVSISATLSGISGSSSLTVIAATLAGVVVTPASWSMKVGSGQQFFATAEFAAATIQDVTNTAVWKSSNPAVATVTATGMVQAVASGTTTISAQYSNRSGSTMLTVTAQSPPNLGQWGAPQSLGIVAIHAALLHTGKILFYGYPNPSPARLYDPSTNSVADVTPPFLIDIFCSGQSFMPDGRLLITGGMDDSIYPPAAGIFNTTFFDPATNTWAEGPAMGYARWYPTNVPMPDGTFFVLAGTDQYGKSIQRATESYNPVTNTWTELPASAYMPEPPDNYPLMTVLASGNVFYAAPRQDSQMYSPATESWSFVSNMNFGRRYHAGAALLPDSQKVMIVGGAASAVGNGKDPTNTTEVIDFSAPSPAWSYSAPMNIARYNHNLIFLADGTLLAIGGNQNDSYGDAVEQPELYDPSTNEWTLMPPQVGERAYHSTAILLPDGRVISAGSDSKKPLENSYEIYSPPYLFRGPRPTITSSPETISYGEQFTITTPDAAKVSRVALIRPGATTHANHMDDRAYIDLSWAAMSGQLKINAPTSPNTAPPAFYLLVIVNGNGVPSVMPFVQLTNPAKPSIEN